MVVEGLAGCEMALDGEEALVEGGGGLRVGTEGGGF